MAANARGVGEPDSMQALYRDVPPVTKFLCTGTFVTALLSTFGLLPAAWGGGSVFLFDWYSITKKFHIWRLITPFIFSGGFDLNFVMHMYVLYENCKRYEMSPYNTGAGGTSADMLFMVLFGMVFQVILAIFDPYIGLGLVVLSEPILYHILYVWSRKDPEMVLNIWGFKFKAMYLPWVYMAIRVVMGGSVTLMLVGVASGHVYWALVDIVPNQYGKELLKTPQFCKSVVNWFTRNSGGQGAAPDPMGVQGGFAMPGRAAAPQEPRMGDGAGLRNRGVGNGGGGGYTWGRGNVLGNN